MSEHARVNYGYIAYRRLWQQFGLGQLLERLCQDLHISYDYARIVESLVINHVLAPSSKRHFFSHSKRYFGLLDKVELQHVYRCLDLLAEHNMKIEEAVFERNRNMFNMRVDVVFYDLTTFHVESQRADQLRDFGFSKAGGAEQDTPRFVLDEDKIEQAARFDGFAAFQCRRLDTDTLEALRQYRQLWRIEKSFRTIKSTMKTRPIFLRTKEHVEGHFVVCFLAFLLEQELEYRLTQRQIEHSPEHIKTALNSMEFSILEIEDEPYYLKGKHPSLASKIFSLLRLKQPTNIMDEQQAMEYINP